MDHDPLGIACNVVEIPHHFEVVRPHTIKASKVPSCDLFQVPEETPKNHHQSLDICKRAFPECHIPTSRSTSCLEPTRELFTPDIDLEIFIDRSGTKLPLSDAQKSVRYEHFLEKGTLILSSLENMKILLAEQIRKCTSQQQKMREVTHYLNSLDYETRRQDRKRFVLKFFRHKAKLKVEKLRRVRLHQIVLLMTKFVKKLSEERGILPRIRSRTFFDFLEAPIPHIQRFIGRYKQLKSVAPKIPKRRLSRRYENTKLVMFEKRLPDVSKKVFFSEIYCTDLEEPLFDLAWIKTSFPLASKKMKKMTLPNYDNTKLKDICEVYATVEEGEKTISQLRCAKWSLFEVEGLLFEMMIERSPFKMCHCVFDAAQEGIRVLSTIAGGEESVDFDSLFSALAAAVLVLGCNDWLKFGEYCLDFSGRGRENPQITYAMLTLEGLVSFFTQSV